MSRETVLIMAMIVLLMPLQVGGEVVPKDPALQIYLPREVAVKDDIVMLGQIGIIRGEESLVARADQTALGRFSVPGQEIVVNRATLLSRLASNGMSSSKVVLKGAKEVTVRQQQRILSGADFVTQATSFVQRTPNYASACRHEPVRVPRDLVIPSEFREVTFQARFEGVPMSNRAKVRVTAVAGEEVIGQREVTLRLKYNRRAAVTLAEIKAGETISPDNVKIEEVLSDHPEPANWRPPYGLVSKQRLAANTVVRTDKVAAPSAPVIVKRNQNVVILIKTPWLVVSATGQALQKGHAGEFIKVRNIDSRRIILAEIKEDGTVRPVF